jgi:DNA-binding FadR family transcriptional regulator
VLFPEKMTLFEPVSSTRLYRMIANQIASKIRAGEFRPGTRLPSERELANLLQVSRTSVREALIALEIEGYVEVRVGTGVFVTTDKEGSAAPTAGTDAAAATATVTAMQPMPGDIGPFDLLVAHLLLEPECAALAAKNASAVQIAAVEAAGRAMEGSDSPTVHNRVFHIAIAEATGNAALVAAVTTLWNLRDSSVIYNKLEQHFVTRGIWQIAEVEHDEIIKAISARDPAAARRAMRVHFQEIRRRLREDFSSELES